jgi:hypothetical protein
MKSTTFIIATLAVSGVLGSFAVYADEAQQQTRHEYQHAYQYQLNSSGEDAALERDRLRTRQQLRDGELAEDHSAVRQQTRSEFREHRGSLDSERAQGAMSTSRAARGFGSGSAAGFARGGRH